MTIVTNGTTTMLTMLFLGWLVRADRRARAGRSPYFIAYAPQEASRPRQPRDSGVRVEF